jgi:hypothetical protein
MKLQFKIQDYQTDAVNALADCFLQQPPASKVTYRIDPGRVKKGQTESRSSLSTIEAPAEHPSSSASAEPPSIYTSRILQGLPDQLGYRDGDRHREDLLLHQIDVRTESTLWLD